MPDACECETFGHASLNINTIQYNTKVTSIVYASYKKTVH